MTSPDPPVVRLAVPPAPVPPARPPFPLLAALAPVVVSLGMWVMTGSAYALVFAALGPVVALAGVADGARSRRRTVRRDAERTEAAIDRLEAAVEAAQSRERQRLVRLAPPAGTPAWGARGVGTFVDVGEGEAPSGIELTGDDAGPPRLADLRSRAAVVRDAPVVIDAEGGIAIAGPPVLARAVARAATLRVAARLSPTTVRLRGPADEEWARRLPHPWTAGPESEFRFERAAGAPIVIRWGRGPMPAGAVLLLEGADGVLVAADRETPIRPRAVTAVEAAERAREIADAAVALGLGVPSVALPGGQGLGELLGDAGPGLEAPLGRDGSGVVLVDLARGPHAIVGGMTGSGKSELLVSWVVGMAHGRPPSAVSFLLVDFKGGASFAPLAELPHVLGVLSDLEGPLARRAIESLRAEILRRERLLADARARAIEDLPPATLERLVVVVDEYAAVVDDHPDLHRVFADIAARGRSLGMHLVLCTQRPAGVVRDAVLANVALRISLRVVDRADSLALVGSVAAAELPASPPGRAVAVGISDHERLFQVALASPADIVAVIAGAPARDGRTTRPWLDPLPDRVGLDELSPVVRGLRFGLVDLPAEQRQPVAVYDVARDGHLLVLGGAGSGRSTALATLAAEGGGRWMPDDPPELWDAIVAALDEPDPGLLLFDDLDRVIATCDLDHRPELVDLVGRLARRGAVSLVVAAQSLGGVLGPLGGVFGARLLLAQRTREDHVLAGGDPREFDARARPGSGSWRGAPMQVALGPGTRLPYPLPEVPGVRPDGELAIATTRAREMRDRLESAAIRVVSVGDRDAAARRDDRPVVFLGDPEAWQTEWELLTRVRRELRLVVVDCAVADHRLLTRSRELPPPLAGARDECWLVEDGRTRRARLEIAPGVR
jgi:S-DNA-T family DNA segregation ATPase FtsK/SpoIIIE